MESRYDWTGEQRIFPFWGQKLVTDNSEAGEDQRQYRKLEDQAEHQNQAQTKIDIGTDVEPALQPLGLVRQRKIDNNRPDDNQKKHGADTESHRDKMSADDKDFDAARRRQKRRVVKRDPLVAAFFGGWYEENYAFNWQRLKFRLCVSEN